jgi:hypothetical protein
MKNAAWTKWSSIAEIISAIAILVTLLYLAIQTQQNALALRANSQQGLLEQQTEFLNLVVAEPELFLLFEKQNLTPLETSKLYAFMTIWVRGRESMYRQYMLGAIDRDSYEGDAFPLIYLLKGTERARNYWVNNEGVFPSDFTEQINAQLENYEGDTLPLNAALFEFIFSSQDSGQ